MKIYRGLPRRLKEKKLVLAIGVFDGVHRGHQSILKKVLARARAIRGTAAVLTFDALPEHVIAPAYAPPSLMGLEAKLEQFESQGMRVAVVARFDRAFASLPADRFADELLKRRLGAMEVVIGADFVFGARAAGDAKLLTAHGLKVHVVKPASVGGRPVSSTRLRSSISDGDMKEAARLLGRPFVLRGAVIKGKQLGRKLGYPTANLALEAEIEPKHGVWGGRTRVLGSQRWLPMVANLGIRPTLRGQKKFLSELHLIDFKGSLYGKVLEAELQVYLRPEQRFESLDALKQQIRRDIQTFRRTRAFHSVLRSSVARLGAGRF